MFDQLIESEPEGADFHNRRTYFLTSSVVVGILFLSAVVISIYAADFSLGNRGLELVELIAPPEMTATEPEPIQPRMPTSTSQSKSDVPSRQINMSRVDEPTIVPDSTSSVKNTQLARPQYENFRIANGPESNGGSGSGRNTGGSEPGAGLATKSDPIDDSKDVDPPPPIKKDPVVEKKPAPQSLGVINGKASYLPKPIYSAAAISMHADGKVDVQVTIDESGNVISAKAMSGHILLRPAAEQAARNAKFTTTYLSKVPVKVTGVIVYNFTR